MTWCPKCKDYFFGDNCSHQEFTIYHPDYYGEDRQKITGKDFESAIELYTENHNIDDPVFDDDVFENPIEITDSNGITKKFNCTAIIDINYTASEVKS